MWNLIIKWSHPNLGFVRPTWRFWSLDHLPLIFLKRKRRRTSNEIRDVYLFGSMDHAIILFFFFLSNSYILLIIQPRVRSNSFTFSEVGVWSTGEYQLFVFISFEDLKWINGSCDYLCFSFLFPLLIFCGSYNLLFIPILLVIFCEVSVRGIINWWISILCVYIISRPEVLIGLPESI